MTRKKDEPVPRTESDRQKAARRDKIQRKKEKLEARREHLLQEIAQINRDLVNLEEEARK